jgi:hypothetical protein
MQLRGSFRVPFGSSSGEKTYDRVCSGACRPSLNLVSKSLDSDHCREVEMACLAAKEGLGRLELVSMDGQSCREEGGCAQNGESDSTRITVYAYPYCGKTTIEVVGCEVKLLWHNVVICEGWVAGVFAPGPGSPGRMDGGRVTTAPHQCPTLRIEQSKGGFTIDN